MPKSDLTDSILAYLYGDYTLIANERFERGLGRVYDTTETRVQGNSISYVMDCLRVDGWRLPGQADFQREIEALGFKVVRGRGLRYFRGGKQNLGNPCDVVTL